MPSFNDCTFVGNLTRDVELSYTKDSVALAKSAIAVNFKTKTREEVMFLDLTVWRDQAETFNKYLSKGSLVLVQGRLQLQTWETPEGQKRSRHALVVNRFQFLDGKKDDDRERRDGVGAAVAARAEVPGAEGDIPF